MGATNCFGNNHGLVKLLKDKFESLFLIKAVKELKVVDVC
jgi:hypothetical protein